MNFAHNINSGNSCINWWNQNYITGFTFATLLVGPLYEVSKKVYLDLCLVLVGITIINILLWLLLQINLVAYDYQFNCSNRQNMHFIRVFVHEDKITKCDPLCESNLILGEN